MLKQEQSQRQTTRLSMKLWLPILESSLNDLSKSIDELSLTNPCVQVKKNLEHEFQLKNRDIKRSYHPKNASGDDGATTMIAAEESLYEALFAQVEPHLFPTQKSQDIAYEIIQNLDENGFFDGDIALIAKNNTTDVASVERIRKRFSQLEPVGVAARDVQEALYFQLCQLDTDEETFEIVKALIYEQESTLKGVPSERIKSAKKVMQRFRTIPAIEYQEQSAPVIPDVSISFEKDKFEVRLNSLYYPDIIVDKALSTNGGDFARDKVKEAMMAANLLNLRKTTLQNIVGIIIEKQFKFFLGGEMVPLKIQDVADILGYNQSTISRAVANKYLSCDRGIFAFRYFFSFAVTESVSTNELKGYVKRLIENENREKPLNDEEILDLIQKRFSVTMVRRSITKYRLELGLPSSKQRKKEYQLMG